MSVQLELDFKKGVLCAICHKELAKDERVNYYTSISPTGLGAQYCEHYFVNRKQRCSNCGNTSIFTMSGRCLCCGG